MNPAQFRLLLAGPKVSRLLPFFTARGYVADAAITGEEALEHMRTAPRHVLLVELDLEDMLLADLLEVTRRENLAGAVLLMDDPAKSGLIVASLLRGIDGYIATPPDEIYMFRLIERQLLAQWALAQQGAGDAEKQRLEQDKQRVEKSLAMERGKVTELVREIASLREELQRTRALSGGGGPDPVDEILHDDDDDDAVAAAVADFDASLEADTDFHEQLTQQRVVKPLVAALKTSPTLMRPGGGGGAAAPARIGAASTNRPPPATTPSLPPSFGDVTDGPAAGASWADDLHADELRDDDDDDAGDGAAGFDDPTGSAFDLGDPGGPQTAPVRRPLDATDDQTSPSQWPRPKDLLAAAAATAASPRPGARRGPALAEVDDDDDPATLSVDTGTLAGDDNDDDDDGFGSVPHTRPATEEIMPPAATVQERQRRPAAAAPVDDASESDLFLDLEEEQTSEVDLATDRPRK